jgi:HlyD family secretion protein
MFIVALLLTGCSLSSAQPTPAPLNLPVYEPAQTVSNTVESQAATEESPPVEGSQQATGAVGDEGQRAPAALSSFSDAGVAIYNGELVSEQQVVVVAQVNGLVTELAVDVGSLVKAGDLLVRQDSTTLEAQRAQALAGLEAAKSQLDLLQSAPTSSDLEAARAAVAAASATYQRVSDGLTDEDRRLATAQLKLAQAAVTVAQAAYNQVKDLPNVGALPQSLQLQSATLQLEAAQAQYDKVAKGPTQDTIAGAYAQLANARAALKRLEDGPKTAQIRAIQSQVKAAETALYLAQLQLNKAMVTAPLNGVVSKVQTSVGAMAAPGAPLITLLSTNVKLTIAVEETRLSQLRIGQPAFISVAAYPERSFTGEIALIAPELDPATRTVQVTIRPQDADGLLAPGMSATVELQIGE